MPDDPRQKEGPLDVLQIVCIALGIFLGILIARIALGLDVLLGGAIGGGVGAALGFVVYAFIIRRRK